MRLISCHIENFGKLHDLTMDFEDGCNVILQENGWGKSTLAAFIKVMLYGFEEEKSRDGLKNERKRYRPWQGGVYGGRLEFEAEGKRYIAARTFGTKEKEDTFSLREKDTNLESRAYSANLGEELFSLDCGSFCRTVFVSQNDCETFATDSVNAKIGNLAEDTDDINNYENVNQRFVNLLNQMSPGRKTGSLYKKKEEIVQLELSVRASGDVEHAIEEIGGRLREKLAEQQTLKEEQAQLLKKQREIGAFKDIQAKQEKYKELCREYGERKAEAEEEKKYFPGRVPDAEELEGIIALGTGLPAAQESARIYGMSEEERSRLAQLAERFRGKESVPDELREWEEKERRLGALKVTLAESSLDPKDAERLEDYNKRFAGGVPQIETLEKVISDWNGSAEKKSVLGQKKLNYETWQRVAASGADRADRRAGGGESFSGGFFLAMGTILILAGILLATVHVGAALPQPAAAAALGLLGAAGIVAGVIQRRRSAARKGAEASEALQANDGLQQMQREILEEEAFIGKVDRDTRRFLAEYGIVCDRDEEILDSLYGLKSDIRDYITLSQRSRDAELAEARDSYRKLSAQIRDFLKGYYPEDPVEEAEYSRRLAELSEECSAYIRLREKNENYLKAKEALEGIQKELLEFLESILLPPQQDLQAQLLEIQRHCHSLQVCGRELENVEKRKEAFEVSEDVEKIMKIAPAGGAEDLQDINVRLEEIAERLEKILSYIADYNRQADDLREAADRAAEDFDRLTQLKEEYRLEREKYELLKRTRELLEQAKLSFTAKYTEPIRQSLAKYYELLTKDGAGSLHVDANADITVDEQGMQREPRFFSTGYRDLFGVCMRMALIDAMYPEEKPFVVLDDPFANLDAGKLAGAMEFLNRIGGEYQVLYFTCHHSRAAGAELSYAGAKPS